MSQGATCRPHLTQSSTKGQAPGVDREKLYPGLQGLAEDGIDGQTTQRAVITQHGWCVRCSGDLGIPEETPGQTGGSSKAAGTEKSPYLILKGEENTQNGQACLNHPPPPHTHTHTLISLWQPLPLQMRITLLKVWPQTFSPKQHGDLLTV